MRNIMLIIIVSLISLIGCSKDNEATVDPTSELKGQRFRSLAYVDNSFGNVYDVLEFKEGNKVEYSYRLQNNSVININYTVLSNYTINSDVQITINHKGYFDDVAELNKATVTTGIISIAEGNLKGVYEKY